MTEPILTPFLDASGVTLYAGDCIEVMRQLPEASVDAIVTDPPYGLEFMGKDWDAPWRDSRAYIGRGGDIRGRTAPVLPQSYVAGTSFQEWTELWAREALRILKPGGHLLAFAGTRTYHRMASGVEDAGFEIRDCIAWMYGSGFPKSLDVSKAIDKAAGAEREIVGRYTSPEGTTGRRSRGHNRNTFSGDNYSEKHEGDGLTPITAPATDAARKWSGWGTSLKPAFEPVVVARKPLVGTVAQNVIEHGTGALNVDGCRIAASDQFGGGKNGTSGFADGYQSGDGWQPGNIAGRWPANVVLDEAAGEMLDEQSGIQRDGVAVRRNRKLDATHLNPSSWQLPNRPLDDMTYRGSGGASRFFYCAKASKKDRNTNGAENTHPTVKPTELMGWLIRLVTPPGGIILDPFGGSGSTGVAARMENVRCILIEREAEYLDIIRQRLDEGPLLSMLD